MSVISIQQAVGNINNTLVKRRKYNSWVDTIGRSKSKLLRRLPHSHNPLQKKNQRGKKNFEKLLLSVSLLNVALESQWRTFSHPTSDTFTPCLSLQRNLTCRIHQRYKYVTVWSDVETVDILSWSSTSVINCHLVQDPRILSVLQDSVCLGKWCTQNRFRTNQGHCGVCCKLCSLTYVRVVPLRRCPT